jgi:hypothetical protein
LGWLHAVPKADKPKKDDIAISRIQDLGVENIACTMPEADSLIVSYFHKLGFNLNVGMGSYPVTWSELKSFSDSLASSLDEWESDQLIMMSREYCAWNNKGKDRLCGSPWNCADYNAIEENRKRVKKQFKDQRAARKLKEN